MNGCLHTQTIERLDPNFSCFNLSEAQRKILWILREAGLGSNIRVSYPSYWREWNGRFHEYNDHELHRAGDGAMDFIVTNEKGEIIAHSDLMRAFIALSKVWPGNVGIGIANADIHLHVDLWHTGSWTRWIEIGKKGIHNPWIIYNNNPAWEHYLMLAKGIYNYNGDGGVDWDAFFARRNMTPQQMFTEVVDAVKATGDWMETIVKWVVIGVVAHFGAKAVGLFEKKR